MYVNFSSSFSYPFNLFKQEMMCRYTRFLVAFRPLLLNEIWKALGTRNVPVEESLEVSHLYVYLGTFPVNLAIKQ